MVDGWGRGFGGGTKQCLFNVGGGKNQDLISVQSNITSPKSPQHVLCAIEFQVKSMIPWWFENQWPFNTAHHFCFSSIKHWDYQGPLEPSGCPWILGATQCGSKLKDPWTKLTYQSILILTFSSLMCDRSSLQLHAMNLLTCSERRCALGAILDEPKSAQMELVLFQSQPKYQTNGASICHFSIIFPLWCHHLSWNLFWPGIIEACFVTTQTLSFWHCGLGVIG